MRPSPIGAATTVRTRMEPIIKVPMADTNPKNGKCQRMLPICFMNSESRVINLVEIQVEEPREIRNSLLLQDAFFLGCRCRSDGLP